jgi:hypothetical protein
MIFVNYGGMFTLLFFSLVKSVSLCTGGGYIGFLIMQVSYLKDFNLHN